MSKKTPAKKSAPKAARTKKPVRARQVHVYTSLNKGTDDLSPQAATIVETIKAAGGSIARPDLLKALSKALTSGQSASRVLSYYKKPLITDKFIKVEKVDASATPAATPAAAPAPAAVEAPAETPVPAAAAGVPVVPATT